MPIAIVSGAVANKLHRGGEAWVRLNWVLGLQQLGFQVCLVEQIVPQTCVDAAGAVAPFYASENLRYFREVESAFHLTGKAVLIAGQGEEIYGLERDVLLKLGDATDLLVNISGHLNWEPLFSRLRRKVYLDIDPGFTQFWHAAGNAATHLAGHDYYYTIGLNIGDPICPVPTSDIHWRHTLPPIALDQWRVVSSPWNGFTTVASWRGPYGPIIQENKVYGQKVHEFRKYVTLPHRTGERYELALDIHQGDVNDLCLLQENGWVVVDPLSVAADPVRYRTYIQSASAEFSAAQGMYVASKSGWFSDRTAAFLASGKPALVQDTGVSRQIPTEEGLLTFSTLDEAIEGAKRIARDYSRHCIAARRLAEEYLDSNRVLSKMLREIDLDP
jgi:hypothetical protein